MMTDLPTTPRLAAEFHEDVVRFVFESIVSPDLLAHARAMLAAAPRELAESFEQAVRGAGLAS